jgi:hypothetical protein
MNICAWPDILTGHLQNTSKKRRSALTKTRGNACKQIPHKSRITSFIHDRGKETHKRTTQAISASHARSRRLFVRPLRTQVLSIINVCARFRWPSVYLGRKDYTMSIIRFEMLHQRRFRRCSNTSRNTAYLRRSSSNTRCVLLSIP